MKQRTVKTASRANDLLIIQHIFFSIAAAAAAVALAMFYIIIFLFDDYKTPRLQCSLAPMFVHSYHRLLVLFFFIFVFNVYSYRLPSFHS